MVGSGGTGTTELGNAVGDAGGDETHTLTVAETPSHNHSATQSLSHTHGVGTYAVGYEGSHDHGIDLSLRMAAAGTALNTIKVGSESGSGRAESDTTDAHRHTLSGRSGSGGAHGHVINPTGGGGAHNNLQPSLVVQAIIFSGVF